MNKGVIISYLCLNPSCENSEKVLEVKTSVTSKKSILQFENLEVCPRCQAELELINFVSGSLEITKDNIN